MPSISAVGNISPVSTITIRPSCSTTVMFLPISPSPPRGRIRSAGAQARPRSRQQAVRLERRADGRRAARRRPRPSAAASAPRGSARASRAPALTGIGFVVTVDRLVDRAGCRRRSRAARSRSPACDRVVDLAHLGADQVRGDEDAARRRRSRGCAGRCRRCRRGRRGPRPGRSRRCSPA